MEQIISACPQKPRRTRFRLRHFWEIRRQRRALLGLSPHLLDDIGLSRSDALREAEMPVWDVPERWRQE